MKTFKLFLLFIIVILLGSCAPKKFITSQKPNTVILHDTIYVMTVDTVYKNGETLKQADAISTLAQIIYYEKIIDHNPTQKKFEHGWILRALKYYNLPITKK